MAAPGRLIARSELKGLKGVLHALDETRKLHLARLNQGVWEMTKRAFDLSQVYVPKDNLDLSKSGHLEAVNAPGPLPGMQESFGQGSYSKDTGIAYAIVYETPYAMFVHEFPDSGIHYTTPGTGNKYLERAVTEVVAEEGNHVPWREDITHATFTLYDVGDTEVQSFAEGSL